MVNPTESAFINAKKRALTISTYLTTYTIKHSVVFLTFLVAFHIQ